MTARDQLLEPFHVLDFDVATGYFHQSLIPQVRNAPADGFQTQSQVGADFFATHFQHEVAG
jgi:hypothetical protein